jgi:hypothetical protein
MSDRVTHNEAEEEHQQQESVAQTTEEIDGTEEDKTEEALQEEEDQRQRERFQGAPREAIIDELVHVQLEQNSLEGRYERAQFAVEAVRRELARQDRARRELHRERAALVESLRLEPPEIRGAYQHLIDQFVQEEAELAELEAQAAAATRAQIQEGVNQAARVRQRRESGGENRQCHREPDAPDRREREIRAARLYEEQRRRQQQDGSQR